MSNEIKFGIESVAEKLNINGDGVAKVLMYDFSRANLSHEHRVHAISAIASICYQNPKALNSDSLYNRLAAESIGLPSSSFEFCSVLIGVKDVDDIKSNTDCKLLNIEKYGIWVEDNKYLLTNYRAVVYDVEAGRLDNKWLKYFNSEEECDIISKYIFTFNFTIDVATRTQMIRHRAKIQEFSRRYVSGKRVPFEHYVSNSIDDIRTPITLIDVDGREITVSLSTDDIIDICNKHYYNLLDNKVKPQDARRIIPQTMYSTLWMSFDIHQLDNYLKLRDHSTAQQEIRWTAEAIRDMLANQLGLDKEE